MLHVMWISSNPDHRLAAAVRPHERDVILDAPHLRCRHRHVRARAWGQVLHLGGYDLGRERYDEVRGARCEVRGARGTALRAHVSYCSFVWRIAARGAPCA